MHMSSGPKKTMNRQAAVAGRFYPGTEKRLREEVRELFVNAKPPLRPGEVPRALIVPHAGYVFSGGVAASAFSQISGTVSPERVFVIASSHRYHFPGAALFMSGNYETPLGEVAVDRDTCRQLTEQNPLFTAREEAHLDEHSLEVQLPFLQEKLTPSFLLVPIILGTQKPAECKSLADTLRPFFTPGNLFVISSDLSHYPSYEDAVKTDRITTEAILANSPPHLLAVLEENRKQKTEGLATSLCGWTSVLTLLNITTGMEVDYAWVDYRNSGDEPMYGDRDRVVGYSAVAVFGKEESSFSLSEEEKAELLKIAEQSILKKVITGERILPEELPQEGRLSEPAGAFVSIYISGKLRGCIGSFNSGDPLAKVVNQAAFSAAQDHRFNPPETDELENMILEISVLTPLKRIHSPEEIIMGKHGIYIKSGFSSGTFLPQVAQKYGWNREEFLGRCSRDKAGLGWEGWKTAELFTYEAIVFKNKK